MKRESKGGLVLFSINPQVMQTICSGNTVCKGAALGALFTTLLYFVCSSFQGEIQKLHYSGVIMCHGVLNHQRLDCLFSRLFRRRSKKTSKLRVTGLCEGYPLVTGRFPSQRASNAETFPFNGVIMKTMLWNLWDEPSLQDRFMRHIFKDIFTAYFQGCQSADKCAQKMFTLFGGEIRIFLKNQIDTMVVVNAFISTSRPRQDGRHFQTIFLNAISWMKMYKFRLRFHRRLFLRVQLTIHQHWFR